MSLKVHESMSKFNVFVQISNTFGRKKIENKVMVCLHFVMRTELESSQLNNIPNYHRYISTLYFEFISKSMQDYDEEMIKMKKLLDKYKLELRNREGNFNRMFTEKQPVFVDKRAGRSAMTGFKHGGDMSHFRYTRERTYHPGTMRSTSAIDEDLRELTVRCLLYLANQSCHPSIHPSSSIHSPIHLFHILSPTCKDSPSFHQEFLLCFTFAFTKYFHFPWITPSIHPLVTYMSVLFMYPSITFINPLLFRPCVYSTVGSLLNVQLHQSNNHSFPRSPGFNPLIRPSIHQLETPPLYLSTILHVAGDASQCLVLDLLVHGDVPTAATWRSRFQTQDPSTNET